MFLYSCSSTMSKKPIVKLLTPFYILHFSWINTARMDPYFTWKATAREALMMMLMSLSCSTTLGKTKTYYKVR